MDLQTKLRYQGSVSTPPLWNGSTVSPFKQIELSRNPEAVDDSVVFKNHRLGKLVEEFVFHQLREQRSITWICDSLQIQDGKRTVGEIDALYFSEDVPVHLEVAYKFYLYDTLERYDHPLGHWIGPNRKDSLHYKLEKLHNRQFPLLHNELTRPYLDRYGLDVKTIRQELCFKAQLFLPYQQRGIDVGPLNADCVAGFYVSYRDLSHFNGYRFFFPVKLDWLVDPHCDVEWIGYSSALEIIEMNVRDRRSPLVWFRGDGGGLFKCFVVFW